MPAVDQRGNTRDLKGLRENESVEDRYSHWDFGKALVAVIVPIAHRWLRYAVVVAGAAAFVGPIIAAAWAHIWPIALISLVPLAFAFQAAYQVTAAAKARAAELVAEVAALNAGDTTLSEAVAGLLGELDELGTALFRARETGIWWLQPLPANEWAKYESVLKHGDFPDLHGHSPCIFGRKSSQPTYGA